MKDKKCFGDDLKKKVAQKRFIELNRFYDFEPEVFDLIFNEVNLVNFNDHDLDILQKLYNGDYSNSEWERLEDVHKLFILSNNQKTRSQKLGVPIFIDSNADIVNEISMAKDKFQVIYNNMYKKTDSVLAGGSYAKVALQAYKKKELSTK